MARRGRFAHGYDAAPVERVMNDPDIIDALRERAAERLAGLSDLLGDELVAHHGLGPAESRLMAAQLLHDASDFVRWVKAGQARAMGLPVRGLVDAMGYSSPTSITRMVDTIDTVAGIQAEANTGDVARPVEDERGHRVMLLPNDGYTLDEAYRRGWLAAGDAAA